MSASKNSGLDIRKHSPVQAKRQGPERRVATPRADVLLIKVGDRYPKEVIPPKEKAADVLTRLGKALSKPGLDPKRLFQSDSTRPVYAYSVDPEDTSRFIREDKGGLRILGHLRAGRFREIKSA